MVEEEEFQNKLQEILEKGDPETLQELVETCFKSDAEAAVRGPLPIDYLLWEVKALRKLGRFAEALEILQALVDRKDLANSSVVKIYLLAGEVLQELQELNGAEGAFLKVIETDPWNHEPYISLVNLFELQERWDDAFEALKKAVAVKPALIHQYEDELRTLREKSGS